MGRKSMFTPQEKRKIEELDSQGSSIQEIAFALDRPYKSVCNEMRKNRVNGKYSAEASISRIKVAMTRLQNLWKKDFTEEERDIARKLLAEGKPFRAVRMTLGLSYERTKRIIEEVSGKPADAPTTSSQTSLWQRVYALEEQVKVLFELLNQK